MENQTKNRGFKKLSHADFLKKLKAKPKLIKYAPVGLKNAPRKGLKRGNMVKPIPLKMREELANDPFMKGCCLLSTECKGRIEFHHNLIYAGKRVNEYGSILPVCHYHHEKESKFKKQLNRIMEFRMTREEKDRYPRRKWL